MSLDNHVRVLSQPGHSEAARVAAVNAVAAAAGADRFTAAMSGVLPILSDMYQTAPPGGELEAACKRALNQFLTVDALTPSIIRHLVGFLNGKVSDQMSNAASALGVMSQRIYHPDEDTVSCVMSNIPRIKSLLLLQDASEALACNLCRIVGGLSECQGGKCRIEIAKQGLLPVLANMYQNADPDSDLEASSLSALNKLALYEGDEQARRAFLSAVLVLVDDKDVQLRCAALGALEILNASIYGADNLTYTLTLQKMPSFARCLQGGTFAERCSAAKVLEGFGGSPLSCHFAVLRTGAAGALVDVGNDADQTVEVKQACVNALARLVSEVDLERKDGLFQHLRQLWLERADDSDLYSVSRFVFDLATVSNAPSSLVEPIIKPLIEALGSKGRPLRQRAALMMLHKLCMLDEHSRQRAVELGCILPAIEILANGEVEDHETASYALVTFSCGMVGAERMLKDVKLFVKRLKESKTRKLENGMTSVLGNLATFLGQDGRQQLVGHGVIDVLLPIMRSRDPSRLSIVAALAVGNLAGSGNDALLAGDEVLIRMIVEAVTATAAGREFQSIQFESWAPTMCLMNLSHNDANKKLIMAADGLTPLLKLLKSNDLRTQMYAARVFWNVAFTEDVEHAVPNIVQVLKEVLVSASDPELRFTCEGALFQLAQRSESSVSMGKGQKGGAYALLCKSLDSETDLMGEVGDLQTSDSLRRRTGHIMLTYHWTSQRMMLWLAEKLEREGFPIWIDLQQKNNTIDSVAKAIEKADVVIVAASLAYRESETCRTEVEYALKNKKRLLTVLPDNYKPDGWLVTKGQVGQKGAIDFSGGEAQWEQALPALVRALEEVSGHDFFGFRSGTDKTNTAKSEPSEDTLLKRAQFRAEHAERRLHSLQKRMKARPDVVDAYDHFDLATRRTEPEPTYGSFLPLVFRPSAAPVTAVTSSPLSKQKHPQGKPQQQQQYRRLSPQQGRRPTLTTDNDTDSKGYSRVHGEPNYHQANHIQPQPQLQPPAILSQPPQSRPQSRLMSQSQPQRQPQQPQQQQAASQADVASASEVQELRAAVTVLTRRVDELTRQLTAQQKQCCSVQ